MVMSGKMDWERVHKEDLARSRGSEWVEPGSAIRQTGGPNRKKTVRTTKAKKRKGASNQRPPMPNCTCGKPIGFIGLHKRRCPLSEGASSSSISHRVLATVQTSAVVHLAEAVGTTTGVTLSQFVAAIKGIRQHKQVRNLFSGILKMLANDRNSTTQQREIAESVLYAMLKELDEQKERPTQVAAGRSGNPSDEYPHGESR
jgi:hypothetical protein